MAIAEYEQQDELQAWLDSCADMGTKRVADYLLYRAFYDGDKGAKLRDRARTYLERQSGIPFCENFAEPVVDVLAERLNVIGFASDEVASLADITEEWWQHNRMDALQGIVHTQALICGDDFLVVEWHEEDNRPHFCRQRQENFKVVYEDDEPGMIAYAVKRWNTRRRGPQNPDGAKVQRLNLYYEDRVEKWYRISAGDQTGRGGWEKWQDEEETEWPTPWVDAEGEPLGVPVVHFRNKPLGDGYGRSRVKAVIPFQGQLNKYAADLNDLIDNHALPQDYATGVSGDTEFKRVAGDMWVSSSAETKFGRLDATPTSNLLDAIEGLLSRMARRSRIPMHLLTGGTPPSGEALKTSESGLVATVLNCQVNFGNSWEDAMLLGLKLAGVFGDLEELPEDFVLTTQWDNPETRSDEADLNVAILKQQLGVSKETLLTELGYDAAKELEKHNKEAEAGVAAFAAVLDSGEEERLP